ncbi:MULTISPECIES: sunset domain-containing protein [Bacillus]|uniref:sunset domain-containing protein n=1 Tax=Bacillus TaxID=1386 RepID=UPI000B92A252|nr:MULTISPECIES: hypothetical protein [Bacillus amyloliquefaciens group]ASS63118.1 putative membrane protein YttA [Bacillus velezensis]ATC50913.1 putative membrane protein YttA [Bacillus velezensis]MCW5195007.1 putative membrane protein YttA [Bacillus amyloliquefaciens]QOC79337.1 hypothetical protein ID168_16680 [Bacillus velezensis]QYM56273.1 hypothetical protein KNV92_16710 [Bacillus velezensis]
MSNAIAIIGFLAFLCAVGYGMFHLICKAAKKEKHFSKKLFWPLLIGGFILLLTGASPAEPDASAVKAEEKYSTLDTAYQKLTKEHQALEKKYESISAAAEKEKSEAEAGNEEKLSKLSQEISELKKTNKSLKQDNEKLKNSQKKLEKTAETLQSENKTLKRQKAKTKSENAETAQNNAPSSGGHAETKASGTSQGCDIKGSRNGIYHTPGSTYYNRTTEPAEMFCSVEEAEAAGYRAPKR